MTRQLTARLGAVVVALVLGVGGGIVTAVVAPFGGGTQDPLHLGVPLENQSCSGDYIMILGAGSTTGALAQATSRYAGLGVRYLRTAASCSALYVADGRDPAAAQPDYVAYLGADEDPTRLCSMRMTPDYRSDYVTRLSSTTDIFVKCACAVIGQAPDLHPRDGGVAEPDLAVWVRGLQSILHDADPSLLSLAHSTGYENPATVRAVQSLQANIPNSPADGVVDAGTWRYVGATFCGNYNY